jgi:hypothetical protein
MESSLMVAHRSCTIIQTSQAQLSAGPVIMLARLLVAKREAPDVVRVKTVAVRASPVLADRMGLWSKVVVDVMAGAAVVA